MKTMRALTLFASTCFVFAQTPAKRPLKLDDMHKFHTVADPQISPDGKWVAYTVATVDVPGDKSDTDVWMAKKLGWRQTDPHHLQHGGENAPRWCPMGATSRLPLAAVPAKPGTQSGCSTVRGRSADSSRM